MTVETVDPATAASGGASTWSSVNAASLLAALGDSSDSTAAWFREYSSSLADRLYITFDPPAGPSAGDLVERVVWRIRHGIDSGGDVDAGTFDLGTPYGSTVGTTLKSTIQDLEFSTIVPAGTTAVDFATGCWIDHPVGATEDNDRYFYKADIDVTFISPPTVTISGPSGTVTATSRPTILWSVTAEKAQTLAQIRVYTQATANAGGFVAGQTDGLIYSANVVDGTTEHQLAEGIPNDDYRVFVRSRHKVNGQDQISAWDSQDWTQGISAPTAPTIGTLLADQSLGVITVPITAPASSTPAVDRIELQRRVARTASELGDYETVDTNVQIAAGATGYFHDERVPEFWQYQYRARSIAVTGGEDLASVWDDTTNTFTSWTMSPYYFLLDTGFRGDGSSYAPSDGAAIRLRAASNSIPGQTRRRAYGRHEIRGRADPVVTYDVVQLADPFQLTALSFIDDIADPFSFPDTYASRQEIDQMLARDTVLVLKAEQETGVANRFVVVVEHQRLRVPDALEAETTRLEVFTLVEVAEPPYVDGATVVTS